MKKIKILEIKIQNRGRKVYGNLEGLAESIKRHGLIHPIVVEERPDLASQQNYILIAGERRIRACLSAGIFEIPCTTRSELTDIERKELELEENLYRQDLSWIEITEMRSTLDQLKREIYGSGMQGKAGGVGWTQLKTAESLGVSEASINQDIKMTKFIKENPGFRAQFEAVPKRVAIRRMRSFEREEKLKRMAASGQLKATATLQNAQCQIAIRAVESESIDLILTDPPYGLDSIDELNLSQRYGTSKPTDNLTPEKVTKLIFDLSSDLFRVLKPGCHIYVFCTIDLFLLLKKTLTADGFQITNFPIVWSKEVPLSPFTGLCYCRSYELILFGYKPSKTHIRPLKTHSTDLIKFPPVNLRNRAHQFEKPIDLLQFFIEESSDFGDWVLDPFAGSGSTIIAASQLQRNALGFELDTATYSTALKRIADEAKVKETVK